MTIYLKDEFNKDKIVCDKILNSIKTTYFKDIVKSSKIYFDPDDFNTTIETDQQLVKSYKDFMVNTSNQTPWLLRFEFDKQQLYKHKINMMDIAFVLNDYYNDIINAVFSDDNSNNLICRIKLEKTENEERDIITELKALEKTILENVIVKGVKRVNKVHMNWQKNLKRYNEESMKIETYEEWVLDTSGTNLYDILGHKSVDSTRTFSNDINEIYEIFGIEAARQVLFNELSSTLKELYVNYRHISLLVDTMTNKGYLMSIDRHGINRVDIGPLAKCSFEETTDILIKAGIFSEVDRINGVSANIMLGQIPPSGTGDSDILIDEWRLNELDIQVSHINKKDTVDSQEDNVPLSCDDFLDDNLGFDFILPNKDDSLQVLDTNVNFV